MSTYLYYHVPTYYLPNHFVHVLGGGPAADPKNDPVHEKIISLIKTSAVGLFNPFDSDSVEKPIADAQVTLPAEPVIYVG